MNVRIGIGLAGFCLFCAWNNHVGAQSKDHSFDFSSHPASRQFTTNDGLPESGVNCVVQDRRGFLWLATNAGLSKFDGYRFKTYKPKARSENSLTNNTAKALWEDKLGRLWVGHDRGLDLFDPQTEELHLDGIKLKLEEDVQRLRPRGDTAVWICTERSVYVANVTTLSVARISGLPIDSYWDVAEARDGSIWFAGESGLVHMDQKSRRTNLYQHEPNNPSTLPSNLTLSLFIDNADRLWVGGWGLSLFEPASESFTSFLTTNHIRDIVGLDDGNLLIGHGRGLYSFDPKTRKSQLLADAFSTSILKDRQGITWHSSLWGLNQINPINKKLRITFRKTEILGQCISSIALDGNNDIWILTVMSGAYRFDPSFTKVLQHVPARFQKLTTDSHGSIWLISNHAVGKYDLISKTITEHVMHPGDMQEIVSSFVDSFGNVWLGKWSSVERYDLLNNVREPLANFPKGPYRFLEDTQKHLWIGTSTGLARYNLLSNQLDLFEHDPNDKQSLSNNTILDMLIDKDHNIWIGTAAGLNKMIKGTENFKPRFLNWQPVITQLPHPNVSGIIDDDDGTLWLTSGSMISHFDPVKNVFRNYGNNDGLGPLGGTSFAMPQYAKGLRTSDGRIAFGTYCKGLVIFHPDSLVDNSYIPPVAITDLLIGNHSVPIANSQADTLKWKSPLTKSISYSQGVKLTIDQNDFSVEFAALNYIHPENNRYKYRLEPYETNWVETNASSRLARYTNIDAGKYTFRVIGSNNDDVWNEEGATLLITVLPPWWQTWWAYSFYSILFITGFTYWRRYENRRTALKNRAKHLSELDELKTQFFTNISHEFRTPLTLILGPLREMYEGRIDTDKKKVLETMLHNGQRLLKLINQLLDISRLDANKMPLHASSVDMVQFLLQMMSSYESLAAKKSIKTTFYPEVSNLDVYVDVEKMEKIIHNVLSNAFKFTNPDGEIIVNIRQVKNECLIIVKDTGIGIPPDQLDKVFDRFYQVDASQTRNYEGSGLGMALAKELVELHKGKITVQSEVGKGTTFTVALLLGKDHLEKVQIAELEGKTPVHISPDIVPDPGVIENDRVETDGASVVLIVEDNGDMRNYIRKSLSDKFRILEAANGKIGLHLAEQSVPDLVISDIMMPEMDGYELCRLIKSHELTCHIPVILLTAKADRESKIAGLEMQADDYLSKPFDADELKLIVRNRIAQRKQMREAFSREIILQPKQIAITSLDEKFLSKVLTIVEDHLADENFSIEELSRQAGYSTMHFYRKLKALTDQTPSTFLRVIRLKRAAELLAKNSDNVSQIAYSVGFSSLSYFNKCFKEQFGVTPGKYSKDQQSRVTLVSPYVQKRRHK